MFHSKHKGVLQAPYSQNSIYHINANVITTRIQKVVEDGEEKTINDDNFMELGSKWERFQ